MTDRIPRQEVYDRLASATETVGATFCGTVADRLRGLHALADVAGGASVLDIGCNDGDVAELFATGGAKEIWGLDFYRPGLEKCVARSNDWKCPAEFILSDLAGGASELDRALAEAPQEFDIVLYLGVHHHLERQMTAELLRAFIDKIISRTTRYLAVRMPERYFSELDNYLVDNGFVEWFDDNESKSVGPLKVYAKSARILYDLNDDAALKRYAIVKDTVDLSDVIFLSIPKSGRTWIRFFLQEYIQAITGEVLSLAPRIMKSTDVSPSVGFLADFYDLFEHRSGEPRILFRRGMNEHPLVLLIRDPRDVVVSAFHFTKAKKPHLFRHHVPDGTMESFVRSEIYGLERIARYQLEEMNFYVSHPGPKILLSYEDMLSEPDKEFRRLISFLIPSPIEENVFSQALKRSSFKEMQELEIDISRNQRAREWFRIGDDNWSGDINDLKVRNGKIGSYKDALPELDLKDYPATAQVTRTPVDPVLLSDTRWTVGGTSRVDGAAAIARALERNERMIDRQRKLEAKIASLRLEVGKRDKRIAKLENEIRQAAQRSS